MPSCSFHRPTLAICFKADWLALLDWLVLTDCGANIVSINDSVRFCVSTKVWAALHSPNNNSIIE